MPRTASENAFFRNSEVYSDVFTFANSDMNSDMNTILYTYMNSEAYSDASTGCGTPSASMRKLWG